MYPEGKWDMINLVVADHDRDRRNEFSQKLLSMFPGSVLYLYGDSMGVMGCLRDHQVDAVFIEATLEEMEGVQLLIELRERYPELPVFLLADNDAYEDDAIWNDATGYLIRPISEEELKNTMQQNFCTGQRP